MNLAVRLLALSAFFLNAQGRDLQTPTAPVPAPVRAPVPTPLASPVVAPVTAPVPTPVMAPVPAPTPVLPPQLPPVSYPVSSPNHPSYSVPNIDRTFKKELEDDSLAAGAVIGIVFGVLITCCIFLTAFCIVRKRETTSLNTGAKSTEKATPSLTEQDNNGDGFI